MMTMDRTTKPEMERCYQELEQVNDFVYLSSTVMETPIQKGGQTISDRKSNQQQHYRHGRISGEAETSR